MTYKSIGTNTNGGKSMKRDFFDCGFRFASPFPNNPLTALAALGR